jgi:hypothetical protein
MNKTNENMCCWMMWCKTTSSAFSEGIGVA